MSFVFIGTNILIIQLSEQFRPKELVTFFKACTTIRKNVLKLYCWIIILNKYKLLVITYSTASIWLLFGSALSQAGPEQHWVKAEPFPRQCSVILVHCWVTLVLAVVVVLFDNFKIKFLLKFVRPMVIFKCWQGYKATEMSNFLANLQKLLKL